VVNTFLGPVLPALAARWSLTDSRSGYLFTTQFLGSMAGVSLSSFLMARRGFRFSLALAYVLMAAGVWGLGLADWKSGLFSTLIFGLGLGLAIPTSNLLISSMNQHRRAAALNTLNFCWGLGAVAAPVALAVSARGNHVQTFVTVLTGLLLLAAVILVIAPGSELAPNDRQSEVRQRIADWPLLAIVGAMFFLYVAIEASVGGWIATLFKRLPAGAGGNGWSLASSFFWGGLVAGRGFAPLVLDRVPERRVVLVGLFVACLAILVLVFSHQAQPMTGAAMAVGFGLAPVFPITIALLSQFHEMEKKVAGPMFALAGLGGAVMPWLVGLVSTWSGSLRAGLLVPLVATMLLLWLHAIGNHGVDRPE
jgi:fucose permease